MANFAFLFALRNIALRKTIINGILKVTSKLNLLIIIGTIFTSSYSLIFDVNTIYCYTFSISAILFIYFPLFCHSLCLLTRFALLTWTRRVQGWSDRKLLSVITFINFILLLPYLYVMRYYKSLQIFRMCQSILNTNPIHGENFDRVLIFFYTPQVILLFLATLLARIEVKSKNKVNIFIGPKQQNIVTAKVQVINGICLILVSLLSIAISRLVCVKIDEETQIQCLTFSAYIPQYFSCFLPPFTYIIFSKTIRLYYKNKFMSLF
jgi:hypothetical protein